MIRCLQRTTRSFGGRRRAFTLLELLVVMAVIGVLTATILPALSKAKQRGLQTRCMSNLKQVGIAIQLFVNDNNDNLPGPAWSGAMATYDQNSSQELIWFIADYLDSQEPSSVPMERPVTAEVFVCPAYQRFAPSMLHRKCYLLNDNVPDGTGQVSPFGYPEQTTPSPVPAVPPLKLNELANIASLSDTFAITDVDAINVPDPTVSWAWSLPPRPVHGEVRNELYFDWHVSAKHVDW